MAFRMPVSMCCGTSSASAAPGLPRRGGLSLYLLALGLELEQRVRAGAGLAGAAGEASLHICATGTLVEPGVQHHFVMSKSGCSLACSRTCGHGLPSAAGMAARFAAFACDHQAEVFLTACAHATPQYRMRWAYTRLHCIGTPGRCLITAAFQCRRRTSAWLSRCTASLILRLRLVAVLPKACECREG